MSYIRKVVAQLEFVCAFFFYYILTMNLENAQEQEHLIEHLTKLLNKIR